MADFQKHLTEFESRGVLVTGASVDALEDAQRMVEEGGLAFPVGYGLDVEAITRRYGAYYDEGRGFLHATGFMLRPDNTIVNAVYSTGSIGRLTPKDSLRIIDYYQKREG